MSTAAKPASKLRMEVNFIGPESAHTAEKVPFLIALGQDANGRPAKVVFHGPAAQRARDDLLKDIENSDFATRRPAIELTGHWGYAKEPRRKGGEVVTDAAGKPVHDRQFETREFAVLLHGPTLELFRAQRAAARHVKAIAKLNAEMDAAEKAGDLAGALSKAKEAQAILMPYMEAMAGRAAKAAAPADEYKAAVAAATEGAVNEPLSTAPEAPAPETPRPIPSAEDIAPVVKTAPAPKAAATAPAVAEPMAAEPVVEAAPQVVQPADAAPPAAAKPATPAPRIPGMPRPGMPRSPFNRAAPRPVAEIRAEATKPVAETAAEKPAAAPVAEPKAEAPAEAVSAVHSEPATTTVEPATAVAESGVVDPEAAAEARFAKAGKDFVDSDKAPTPALENTTDAVPPPPPTERPVPQPPSEGARPAPPPPPSVRPVPQPPSEGARPAPPRRMGFPMRPR